MRKQISNIIHRATLNSSQAANCNFCKRGLHQLICPAHNKFSVLLGFALSSILPRHNSEGSARVATSENSPAVTLFRTIQPFPTKVDVGLTCLLLQLVPYIRGCLKYSPTLLAKLPNLYKLPTSTTPQVASR